MPTIDQAVDYLIKNHALELGESTWTTYDNEQEVHQIDWDQLFPPTGRKASANIDFVDGNRWDLPNLQQELAELNNVLGIEPQEKTNLEPNWDICAWYQPIHFFGHDWGIFIREDCLKRTAFMIARFVKRSAVSTDLLKALYRAAVYMYFLHEQYHHKVECLGFRLHVVQRKSAFLPYHKLIYAGTKNTDDQLEEALANADCYKRLDTQPYAFWLTSDVVKATRAYLEWQYPLDPPGYRMASHYLTKPEFDEGEKILQAQVKEISLNPAQPIEEWAMAPRMLQSFFTVNSNIWTVIPAGTKSRLPIKPVAPVRTCSTSDMIDLYLKAGYTMNAGGKGSHVKLKKPGAPMMILPGNRSELSPGVTKTALRVLGNFSLHDLPSLVKRRFQAS